jgi:hypothetical protein
VAAPELGFLFPAFDDRAANIYNALFYSRKADDIHQEFIDAVFHTEPPMSAAEQTETFRETLSETLEDDCSAEVVQALHEQMSGKIALHKESRDPEPLAMTVSEIGNILRDCGVADERVDAFQKTCGERFGEGALNPVNLIDAGKFEVKTSQATLSVDPEYSYTVETRIIDGKKYLLIPVEDGMEINGFAVSTAVREGSDPLIKP